MTNRDMYAQMLFSEENAGLLSSHGNTVTAPSAFPACGGHPVELVQAKPISNSLNSTKHMPSLESAMALLWLCIGFGFGLLWVWNGFARRDAQFPLLRTSKSCE
jgi:hypothetical protein